MPRRRHDSQDAMTLLMLLCHADILIIACHAIVALRRLIIITPPAIRHCHAALFVAMPRATLRHYAAAKDITPSMTCRRSICT